MTELTFEHSLWWSIPCLMGALAAAAFLYFYRHKFTASQRYTLAALRFSSVFLILLLFLAPFLKVNQTEEEKPILVWLEDHSRSMILSKDSSGAVGLLNKSEEFNRQLEDKYQVEAFQFGEELKGSVKDTFSFIQTDIANTLYQVQERYYNQNVGGVVLLTDGIYNLGSDPVYLASQLAFPVFTLGLGDSSASKDIFIDRLVHNDYSYLNNRFPLQVHLKARKQKGQRTSLKLLDNNNTTVESRMVEVDSDDFYQRIDFLIDAKKPGIQRYTVVIERLPEESNTSNNTAAFSLDILDKQKKIWIIGKAPHPDIAALKRALVSVKDFEVSTYTATELQFTQGQADLMVLHQPDDQMLEKWYDSGKPGLLFYGPQSSSANFSTLTKVFYRQDGEYEEVLPELNTAFNLFNLSRENLQSLSDFPPLLSPFGEINSRVNGQTLFYRKIGSVSTNQPLWLFAEGENRRWSVINGINLWQWRMADFRKNESHRNFDDLIQKTVLYLTAKKEEQRFVANTKSRHNLQEGIRFSARLYNASLELTNKPEARLIISDSDDKKYTYSFGKTNEAYQLEVGSLPEGLYSWEARVELDKELFVKRGEFSVEKLRVEESDLVARFDILRKIAESSGGRFYKKEDVEQMLIDINSNDEAKTIQFLKSEVRTILTLKWLFFLFLIFLSAEWGLRKYWGNY